MATSAEFTINGTPFFDRGFDAEVSDVVALQLAAATANDVHSCVYSVASKSPGAPDLAFSNDGIAVPPTAAVTVTMPADGTHSYVIQCQVNGGALVLLNGEPTATLTTKTRMIAVRSPTYGMRKMVVLESDDYSPTDGWAEAFAGVVDVVEDLALSGGGVANVTGTAPITVTGTTTKNIAVGAASGSASGLMSSAHFVLVDGATNLSTASTIPKRDANGRIRVEAPNDAKDAANKAWTESAIATAVAGDVEFDDVQGALAVATGAVAFNGQRITEVAEPVDPTDAATKGYVDDAIAAVEAGDVTPAAVLAALAANDEPVVLNNVMLKGLNAPPVDPGDAVSAAYLHSPEAVENMTSAASGQAGIMSGADFDKLASIGVGDTALAQAAGTGDVAVAGDLAVAGAVALGTGTMPATGHIRIGELALSATHEVLTGRMASGDVPLVRVTNESGTLVVKVVERATFESAVTVAGTLTGSTIEADSTYSTDLYTDFIQPIGDDPLELASDVDVTGRLKVDVGVRVPFVALTYASTTSIDWAEGFSRSITLTGPVTFTSTGLTDGARYTLRITQDATGGRLLVAVPSTWKFPGGTTPTLSTAGGAVDVFEGISDGTNIYWRTNLDAGGAPTFTQVKTALAAANSSVGFNGQSLSCGALTATSITNTGAATCASLTSTDGVTCAGVTIHETKATPSFVQTKRTGTGANAGETLTIAAQDGQNVGAGTNNNGGNLVLASGAPGTGGTGGAVGTVTARLGATHSVRWETHSTGNTQYSISSGGTHRVTVSGGLIDGLSIASGLFSGLINGTARYSVAYANAGAVTVTLAETQTSFTHTHTKRSGTGANAGAPLVLTSQDGQNQTGANANNDAGAIRLKPGVAGTGGSGAAGKDGNISLFGDGSFGGGGFVVFQANATTVPTSNPVGGVLQYAEGGAFKVRGTSGTITTVAPADPHCPTCGSDFVDEKRNDYTGEHYAYCYHCEVAFIDVRVDEATRAAGYARAKAEAEAEARRIADAEAAARAAEEAERSRPVNVARRRLERKLAEAARAAEALRKGAVTYEQGVSLATQAAEMLNSGDADSACVLLVDAVKSFREGGHTGAVKQARAMLEGLPGGAALIADAKAELQRSA